MTGSKEKIIEIINENFDTGTKSILDAYGEGGIGFFDFMEKSLPRDFKKNFLLNKEDFAKKMELYIMQIKAFLSGITRMGGLRREVADLLIEYVNEITESEIMGTFVRETLDDAEERFNEEGRSFFEKRSAILCRMIKMANHLDSKGFSKEADYLDKIILKFSQEKKSKEEYEKSAFEVLSKMLTYMAEEKITVSGENLPIKLEAKPARALYDEFMGNSSFPETNSSIENLDPSIQYVSFNKSKHEMTVVIVVDMIKSNTMMDDSEDYPLPENYSLVTYEAIVTPNFVESKDKSEFVDSANVTITLKES